MLAAELKVVLEQLIATWENEVVEFKQASNDYSTDEIGKYFSALANKVANLLTKLRRAGRINNTGSRGHPIWKLAE